MDLIDKYLTELGRPKDSSGKQLYGMDDYVLVVKSGGRKGKYVGMGNFPMSHRLESDEGSARAFTGHELMDMGYDWQLDYVAKKVKI